MCVLCMSVCVCVQVSNGNEIIIIKQDIIKGYLQVVWDTQTVDSYNSMDPTVLTVFLIQLTFEKVIVVVGLVVAVAVALSNLYNSFKILEIYYLCINYLHHLTH